jgi:large subunit ribosomal protein L32
VQIQYCQLLRAAALPHRVCPNCGYYQGREIVKAEEEKGDLRKDDDEG